MNIKSLHLKCPSDLIDLCHPLSIILIYGSIITSFYWWASSTTTATMFHYGMHLCILMMNASCVFHTQCNIIFIYKVFPLGHKTDHLWPCKVMIMYWLTFYIHMYLQAWELYVLRRHWICYNCMLLWTTLSGAAIVTMLMYCVSGVRTDPLVSWQSIQYM